MIDFDRKANTAILISTSSVVKFGNELSRLNQTAIFELSRTNQLEDTIVCAN